MKLTVDYKPLANQSTSVNPLPYEVTIRVIGYRQECDWFLNKFDKLLDYKSPKVNTDGI
jgi:hypothetical protein